MGLRVISTKLSEEEYSKISQICNETGDTISSLLKQCVMNWVEKETSTIVRPNDESISIPEFSLSHEKPVQENKITPKIRYQYF